MRNEHSSFHHLTDNERNQAHSENTAAKCAECGLHYTSPGFEDLIIPDPLWRLISPTGERGGLLCPNCMCALAKKSGIQCRAEFTSGPFANHEYDRNSHKIRSDLESLRALLKEAGEALEECADAIRDDDAFDWEIESRNRARSVIQKIKAAGV